MSPRIPILMYHSVTPRPVPAFRKYSVTPRSFHMQMRCLERLGYTAITLDQLLQSRAGHVPLPRRPVIITFDDGFQDCVDYAVPVLQEQHFTAVFYLVAGLAGQMSRWLVAERGLELPLMTWSTARQLVADGFQCGAHTMTHPRLATLARHACRDELARARARLEDELGHAVVHLAYPYGSYSPDVREVAAEEGYRTACTVRAGLSLMDDDLLALHRVPVNGEDTLLDFVCRLQTAYPARDTARMVAGSAMRRMGRWRTWRQP